MKIILTTAFMAIATTLFAQINKEQLVGKWEFHQIYEQEKLDSVGLKMALAFFGETYFEFNEDNLCQVFIMNKLDNGTYQILEGEDGAYVELTTSKGEVGTMNIIESYGDTMAIEFARAKMILIKSTDAEPSEIVVEETMVVGVSATMEQMAKKWMIHSEIVSESSPEMAALANDLVEGSYIDLKQNGKYHLLVIGIKEKGTWTFGENNTTIVTAADDMKQIWTIISISETELIMVQGNGRTWKFSAQ